MGWLDRLEESFEQFKHFDEGAYRYSMRQLKEPELRRQHAIVQRKLISAGASVGGGIGGAVFTGGASLVVSGIGARRINVNTRRKRIIEEILDSEGWEHHNVDCKDFIYGVGPSLVGAVVLPGAEAAVGHFVGHTASMAAAHHGMDTIRAAVDNPGTFASSMVHGAENQVSAVLHGVSGHAGQYAPVDPYITTATTYLGSAAGHAAATAAETHAVETAAKQGFKYTLEKILWTTSAEETSPSPIYEPRPTISFGNHGERPRDNATNTQAEKILWKESSITPAGYISCALAPPLVASLAGHLGIWIACVNLAFYMALFCSSSEPFQYVACILPAVIYTNNGLQSLWWISGTVGALLAFGPSSYIIEPKPHVSSALIDTIGPPFGYFFFVLAREEWCLAFFKLAVIVWIIESTIIAQLQTRSRNFLHNRAPVWILFLISMYMGVLIAVFVEKAFFNKDSSTGTWANSTFALGSLFLCLKWLRDRG